MKCLSQAKWLDLTQRIETDMPVYPGDPAVLLESVLTHEQNQCCVKRLCLGTHTGTHIDVPFHFLADGKKITDFPVDKFLGTGIVIEAGERKPNEAIERGVFEPYEQVLRPGSIVLVRTGWSRYFEQEKYQYHPYLTKSAAEYLASRQISIVGIDAFSVDSSLSSRGAAHLVFLSREILIVENLTNLAALVSGQEYFFSFLPLLLQEGDASPIRAVAQKCKR
jgi:Predicted metal-dependent hydrolase